VRFELGGQTYAAPLINLPSLKIGGMEVRNIPTLIWDLSEYPGIDGFLGMTFLRHFQVEIKEQERLVILTKTYS
jgi:predicted aspartyl protease